MDGSVGAALFLIMFWEPIVGMADRPMDRRRLARYLTLVLAVIFGTCIAVQMLSKPLSPLVACIQAPRVGTHVALLLFLFFLPLVGGCFLGRSPIGFRRCVRSETCWLEIAARVAWDGVRP